MLISAAAAAAAAGLSLSHKLWLISLLFSPFLTAQFTISVSLQCYKAVSKFLHGSFEKQKLNFSMDMSKTENRDTQSCASCKFATYVEKDAPFNISIVIYTQPWILQPL